MSQIAEIEAFVQVVEAGGFRAAAERMALTASSVSKRVRQLEERLGARLLNRTTRRVDPTDVGLALYERAVGILSDLEDAQAAVSALQAEPQGHLRVGAPMDFARRHLAGPLADFARLHPRVSLSISLTDRFVDVVGEGFDLVVRIGRLADSSLVARRLARCRRVLVASPDYLARAGTPASTDDLAEHAFLEYALDGDGVRSADGTPVRTRVKHRTDNGEMMRALARAGEGVALLPTFLVGDDLREGSLVEVLTGRVDDVLTVHALTPHRNLLSTKVRLLIEHLREALATRAEWA